MQFNIRVQGEWSAVVGLCVKEGCSEKSVGIWREGEEEVRTTKEVKDYASGAGDQECWGGCNESSKMEKGTE